MSSTVITTGAAQARKLFSVAAFALMQRSPSLSKLLKGPAPTQSDAERKLKGQTSADYPIVQINDLKKTAGDKVSVDLYQIVGGKPVMGDNKLAGNGSALSFASMDIVINQYRKMVDPGGRMTQQRTLHNLRTIAMAQLTGYFNRLNDQIQMAALAGARGFQTGADWVLPLESDADFNTIMVNAVLPPSTQRRFFANDATSAANIDSSDILKLADIDKMRARLDDMAFPIQPIRLEGDPSSDENPLYLLLVTSRQWYQLQVNTDTQNWRTFLANALERGKFTNHPLFLGETGMWAGIAIKKIRRSCRFPVGSTVREYAADNVTINNATTAVDVDRAILVGAQALACAYGKETASDYYMSWHEEEEDHGNTVEISGALMQGHAKLKFTDQDGIPQDNGVMTIDSYAPAV